MSAFDALVEGLIHVAHSDQSEASFETQNRLVHVGTHQPSFDPHSASETLLNCEASAGLFDRKGGRERYSRG